MQSPHFTRFKKIKVTFILTPIIIIIEDEDRRGPWETFARDRDRFTRRIHDVEKKIGWCFEPSHRDKIFKRRVKQDIPAVSV